MNLTVDRKKFGQSGEQLAADFLTQKGYQLLGKNISNYMGEIDLLMEHGPVVILVEVKTQHDKELIDPVFKVTPAKQKKLRMLSELVATKYPDRNIRVDVVTVCWPNEEEDPDIMHYENVLS